LVTPKQSSTPYHWLKTGYYNDYILLPLTATYVTFPNTPWNWFQHPLGVLASQVKKPCSTQCCTDLSTCVKHYFVTKTIHHYYCRHDQGQLWPTYHAQHNTSKSFLLFQSANQGHLEFGVLA